MLSFPNCKINLGLRILSKREDGYHNLETIFYPVPLKDALEIIPSQQSTSFSSTGIEINGSSNDNLCLKAYHLLKKDFPQLPPVQIHLHKAIPIGAGLGGGSADAAFTLKLLNDKFHLNISTEQLIQYALQLGSDCPFFINNEPCFATGRGEIMGAIKLTLKGWYLLLINPGIHINTGWAFTELANQKKQPVSSPLKELILQPVENWKDIIINDFEAPVFEKYPEIEQIKQTLYNTGAAYASMSGSGSTVYGLFKNQPSLPALPQQYFLRLILL